MRRILLTSLCSLFCLGLCASGSYQSVELHSAITSAKPMTGLVLWPDNAADRHATYGHTISLEFQYCLPCKVVTGKSNGKIQYNWTWLENILNDIASRGHQAVLRFRYEYPSSTDVDGSTKGMTAVPAYIKALPDYQETYKKVSGDGPTYYADWSNSELQWFTKQFYTDFAARYATDPRIAFLEVGFGHWSEYHIYGCTLQLGKNFPTKAYQSSFFQHLDTIMPIPWLCSVDAGDDAYSPLRNDAAMMGCRFGLFDDSFMHSEHDFAQGDGWNELCWQWSDPTKTRWHTGVCGGEVSYYTEDDQHNFLNPAGMYGVTWEQASAKYHITFMNSNDAPEGSYGTPARFLSGSLACGYTFRITALETNGDSTRITILNEGVAPIYRDAYLTLGGVRDTKSLTTLLPGQSRTAVLAGDARTLALTITSDYVLAGKTIPYVANLSGVTGLVENYESTPKAEKILRNGHVLIRRNGRLCDLTGRAR